MKAFRELQSYLCSEPIADYPPKDRAYALIIDASFRDEKKAGGLGAILTQVKKRKIFMSLPMQVEVYRNMKRTIPHSCLRCKLLYGEWTISQQIYEADTSLCSLIISL